MPPYNALKKTKQRFIKKRIFGFDIETANNNKTFVCCAIYSEDYQKHCYTKEEFLKEICHKRYENAFIVASNLTFDYFGIFFGSKAEQKINTLFRGSDLLSAETYVHKGEFYHKKPHNKSQKRIFIDTYNYIKLSLDKMGKIIGHEKLNKPEFLGQEPKNEREWNELLKYNMQDSKVTYEFTKYLFDGFELLGATVKKTIASTTMSLFKNKYLDMEIYQPSDDILIEQFESYYGGRTEAFKRGYFENANYYDFNSLYPSVMHDYEFPDPNSLRISHKNTKDYIMQYEGCSNVKIYVPETMEIPLLPARHDKKLLFPTGNLEGWYTHVEIRRAIKEGCVLMEVRKTHYFTKMCKPFKSFTEDLYNKRREYQKEGSDLELIVKLLMNSLYGKFGQKFIERDNYVPMDTIDITQIEGEFERVGNYARLKQRVKPSSFCIPIWASYITAYARIKLFNILKENDPIYCDTDSIITKNKLPESSKLGDLKLEMTIDEGYIVRPKFYALCSDQNEYVKIKGLGKRLNYIEFIGLLHRNIYFGNSRIYYDKFVKFKEALRRDLIPNEIIKVHKEFSLEDSKRNWNETFNMVELQNSKPLNLKSIAV